MSERIRDIVTDLRERRLLPVAILLVAAIVAVPVFLLRSGEPVEGGAADIATTAGATAASAEFQLEVAEPRSSDLESFSASDPFAPKGGAARRARATDGGESGSGAGRDGAARPSESANGGGGGGADPAPQPGHDQGGGGDGGGETVRRSYVYTLDLTVQGPDGVRRYRNLERLRMLPSAGSPLLVHLGITEGGGSARFLVDATVTLLEGEGACAPSRAACATLALEPGEQQAFADADGRRYLIRVDQIRERRLSAAGASADAPADARQSSSPERRFQLPPLVDVVTEEVQR